MCFLRPYLFLFIITSTVLERALASYPPPVKSALFTFSQYAMVIASAAHFVYSLFTKRDFNRENYELLLQMVSIQLSFHV